MKAASGPLRIVALSGPVCAGKTTLALLLSDRLGFLVVRTRHALQNRLVAPHERLHRQVLQELGNELDAKTRGAWVADAARQVAGPAASEIVVDAVRTGDQIRALRALGETSHVHLTAAEADLKARYAAVALREPTTEFQSYDELKNDPTEASVRSLAELADLVVDTSTGPNAVDEVVRRLSGVGRLP